MLKGYLSDAAASPRGRGWTPFEAVIRAKAIGFPAWAGMDLGSASRCRDRRWLPRVGGDGPQRKPPSPDMTTASPRGRGWTPDGQCKCGARRGFPAWAGMDP